MSAARGVRITCTGIRKSRSAIRPFRLKCGKKPPFIEERDDPRHDPAPEIDAACGKRLEGKVPRLRSEEGDEQAHRPDAEIGRPRERRLDDDRGGIGRPRQALGEPGRLLFPPLLPEKPVEPPEPRPRTEGFITDMIGLFLELTEEFHLQRV